MIRTNQKIKLKTIDLNKLKTVVISGFFVTTLILLSARAEACSSFFIQGETLLLGKNFDWYFSNGYLIKNNRGQIKYAYGLSENTTASWISEYGSITFNQIGKEFPFGGINEKGLVVEMLWSPTAYYQDNSNPEISELEWIQYQLDCYQSVDDIIANINQLTIRPVKAKLHYFIADRSGNSAVIDFIEGRTVISRNNARFQVVTNSTYENSVNYYKKVSGNVDTKPRDSYDRFCQISNKLNSGIPATYQQVFEILDASSENQDNFKTFWSIVYNLSNLTIHFKTNDNQSVNQINLLEFNFDENEDILVYEIGSEIFKFTLLTQEMVSNLTTGILLKMNIHIDDSGFVKHQMKPDEPKKDTVFINAYTTVKIKFKVKKPYGTIYYMLTEGEENYKLRKGFHFDLISVGQKTVNTVAYGVPVTEIALISFQDVNNNENLDLGIFGIPKEPYGFSNNARGFFGTPPGYKKAKTELIPGDNEMIVVLK